MFFYPAYSFFLPIPFWAKLVPFLPPKGTTLHSTLCLFYSLCLFVLKTSFKKDTTLCFHSPHPCRAQLFILYYYSFSFHFRSHLVRILNVTVGFLSLLYLFLFHLQREQPSLLPCVFFIACVFFPQSFLKKDTTSCFHSPHPCRAQLFIDFLFFFICISGSFLSPFASTHIPLVFNSFSVLSHDHLATILNVTIRCLVLFYLVLFGFDS